jgi:hypothetical protein
MSLQLIAKQMEAKGRKGDSMLVHMTPGEVAGLQKLAESAGGSLTINPETGLVEANFLKKLISSPMFAPLAGAGLMMIPGVGPMMAAGLVGGGTALATGDIGKGAMAGLGAYGGAGLAGGLMGAGNAAVSQAATAANPAFMGPMPGAATGLQAAKTGATSLGTEAGRQAFMQGVGGVGGLAKAAGMAAAPMLTQEQKMAEAPVDDERYVYDFDYGRTGADSTPVASSRERTYFQPTYRRVFSAAEGGEVADAAPVDAGIAGGMSGASKAAFDYLMGNAPTSRDPARSPLIDAQLMEGVRPVPKPVVGSDNMYAFDPATGTFLRNPNIPGASTSGSPVGTSFSGIGGSDNVPMSQQTKDFLDNESFLQREARMGEFQNLFNLGPTGALFSALRGDEARAPNFGTLFGTGDAYKNLSDENVNVFAGQTSFLDPQQRAEQQAQNDSGGGSNGGLSEPAGGWSAADLGLAQGGLLGLAKGGMKSGGFVVPADVVSMVGEGNTDAGYNRIKSMIPGATAIKGKDGGQADTVKTSIEGKQPARVAHGEMYIPPETVKRMGGAKKLYAMMDRVRQQATGSKKQIKPVSLKQAMA